MNTNVKLKRILSLALSLCMVLSYDVPIYAADGVVRTYEYTPETCPGHVYTELVEVMEGPTCTEAGIGIYACGKCGYVDEYEGIGEAPALGHDLHVDREEATCTEDGSITTTCTRCDYYNVEPIPANGQHDFEETEKVEVSAATCTEPQKIGYKCKNCGAFQEGSIEEAGEALGHDVEDATEETVSATCMHGGYTYKICARSDCGEEVIQGESGDPDPSNHEYEDELSVISEATCHQGEVRAKKCKNPECDAYDEDSKVVGEDLNPENHEWSEQTHSADCENNAKVVKVCQYHEDAEEFVKDLYQESVDNGEEDATLKAKGHTEKTIPAVEATCKEPGKTAGKECLVCHKVLVEQTDVEADASKHVYGDDPEVLKEETCSKPGAGKYTCTVCGNTVYKAIPARHIYDEVIIKKATCTEPGEKAQICNREGGCTNPSDPDSAKTVVIPATGHDWNDGTETKPASCTEAGEKTFTCGHCEETTTTVIPMVEHSYGEDVIGATCNHPAQKGTVCSVCRKVKPGTTPEDMAENDEGYEPKKTHAYVKDEEQSEDETCDEAGLLVEKCSNCNDIKTTTVPASGHTFKETDGEVVLTETLATCTEAGKWTKYCEKCEDDIELTAQEYEEAGKSPTPAINHANAVAREKIPATCQEVGHEAGIYCEDCGYIDGGEEIPVDTTNGHNWQTSGVPLKEATCTKDGVSKYECKNDGCTATKYDKIPAEHTWGIPQVTREATCEAAGEETRTCTKCDETDNKEIEPLGHEWGEWVVDTEATCGKAGKKHRVCKHDSEHVDEDVIQATGEHTYAYEIIEADCENPKRVGTFCEDCGYVSAEAIVVKDDNKQDIIDAYKLAKGIPADEADQTDDQKAALATFEAKLTPVAALGHDMEGDEVETVTEATCTAPGVGKKKCQRTGCDHEEDVVISATGHEITGDYHAPTCNENGKIISTCGNCDYYDEMDLYEAWGDESEKATGHNYQLTETLKPATCTSTGIGKFVCAGEDCGESKYDVIPKSHTFDGGEELQKATCTTDGKMLYTCSECGHKETVVIPATGHNYGERELLEATCTEPARVGRKCANGGCGALIAVVVVTESNKGALAEELSTTVEPAEALGHIWERTPAAEPTETTEATCTEDGEKLWRCVCDEEHTEVITALGHSWTEAYEEATCTHAGRVKKTCSECDEVEYDEETFAEIDPELAHSWETVEEIPATCIAAGTSAGKVCTVCGTLVGCDEIPVDTEHGHAWDEGVEAGENICENGGTLVRTCTLCDEETPNHTTEEPIEAGHKWVRKTLKDEETGKTMAIVKGCDRCSAIDEYLYMPKGYGLCPDHGLVAIPEDFVIPAVPATCTEAGWSEGRKCPTCEKVILEPKEVPATGHTFGKEETLEEPTCNEPGSKAKVCGVCGEYYDEEDIPATGEHDYEDTLVEGTCHTNAAVKHLCKDCGTEDPEHPAEEIPGTMDENAHTYDGTECTQCHVPMPEGYAYCEEHGWVAAIVVPGTAATCTAAGLTDGLKCPTCDEVIEAQEEIPMTDHAYDWVVVAPATCIDTGTKVEKCSVCEQEGETEEIPATGEHDYSVLGWIDATCSENGYVTYSCSGCGLEDESAREEVPGTMDPDNHTYEEEETPATCTENKKISYVCSGCGQADPDRPETEVPGTAGHVFVDGTCEACGIKNATAVTSGSTSAVDGNNKVTLSSDISVAETDVEIVEIGVLYITSKNYDGDAASDLFFTLAEDGTYTIGNPSVRVERYTSSNADLESYMNVYVTINLGTSEANTTRTLYGRGYVIVKKDGKYSVQFDSNVIQGTYAGGFNAA